MKSSTQKIAVKNLEPYPPRTGDFPHSPEAQELMDKSLKQFGDLPKFVGRPHPTDRGKFQVPYGALTLERITKLFGAQYEVSVQVADYSNDEMIRLCDIENAEVWHNLPLSYLEVVAAVIAAHETGEIKITVQKHWDGRDIAQYLGGDWVYPGGRPKDRVLWCVKALALIKSGDLEIGGLVGLNTNQVDELVSELTRRKQQRERDALFAEKEAAKAKIEAEHAANEAARAQAKARQKFQQEQAEKHRKISKSESQTIIRDIGKQLREHKLAATDVRRRSEEVAPPIKLPQPRTPWIFQAAQRLATQLNHILAHDDERTNKIREICRFRDKLDPLSAELLGNALNELAQRATNLATALGQAPVSPQADANPRKLKGNSQ